MVHGDVVMFGKVFDEGYIGKCSCLFQSIDSSGDFEVAVSLVVWGWFILINDLLRNEVEMEAHEFWAWQFGVEIHVGDVHGHILCLGSGEDTILVDLDGVEVGHISAGVAIII